MSNQKTEALDSSIAHDRATHLLKLASKAAARALQDKLAERSVAYGHWTFMRILWKCDGIGITDLSRRAHVAKPAAVSAVQAMEKLGYVRRVRREGNQKNVYIHLTPSGWALEKKLVPLAEEVNDLALAGLDEAERDAFRHALLTVIRNIDAARGDTGTS
ncbi:MarR family winged helix-turn-helix transcriptional regulator [Rhodosalinus sp. FB01]|uniref:MarR family winged helix-turn-helix transcriptional regulator n=1 Tax=Rhodosalinus sp. FB01 TaxID=3239194 RepID=UPI0035266BFB